jgi:hypothetical protein
MIVYLYWLIDWLVFIHFSVIKKKLYEGTPIESPIIFFLLKICQFFHILNDNMHMMLSVCCFWIFNTKNRCRKSWVSFFFNKNEFIPNLWVATGMIFLSIIFINIFHFNSLYNICIIENIKIWGLPSF